MKTEMGTKDLWQKLWDYQIQSLMKILLELAALMSQEMLILERSKIKASISNSYLIKTDFSPAISEIMVLVEIL